MFSFLKNNNQFIALDIGSQKISGASFIIKNGSPLIIKMDHQKSKGIRRSKLNNIEDLSSIINLVCKNVSSKSGKKELFCNITDPNIITKKNTTKINSGKLGVTKKEIRKIYRKNLTESNIKGKHLIYSSQHNFILDDDNLISNPLGKKCSKLGLISYNLFVENHYINELGSLFIKNKVEIKNFFDSGVASSYSCLDNNEKKEGVLCIDIGAETTKIVVYSDNKIIFCKNLGLAGDNVTSDVSHGLQISIEAAEHAKIMYGSVVAPFNEKVEIEIDSKRRKLISKNLLYGIIKPRYEEILEIIRDRIFDDINARLNIKSVVLTGGASKIFGIKNISENIFNRKAKVGKNLIGDISSQEKPEFSTLMGIIKLANDFFMYNQIPNKSSSKVSVIMDKIDNWIEESYA